MSDTQANSWPLMAGQSGMWFAQQLDPANPTYQIAECLEIHGPVDTALFQQALHRLVAETEVLRLRFPQTGGEVRQTVAPVAGATVPVTDLRDDPDPWNTIREWARADLARPVDLERGPAYAMALFPAGDRFFWYQRGHHAAGDAYSGSLLAVRVAEIYTALAEGRPVGDPLPPYPDLLAEDAAYRASEQFAADRRYWTERLAGRPETVGLGGRSAPAAHGCVRHTEDLAPATADRIRAAARRLRTGLPVLATAATALYTHRLTGAEDLVLGLPVTGRATPLQRRTPGMLANVLPIRLTVRPDTSLTELARRAGATMREALRHQRYRYEDLQRDLGLVGGLTDAGGTRLFGTLVNVMAFHQDLSFAGHPATVRSLSEASVDDLAFVLYDRAGQGMRLVVNANPDVYDPTEVAGHARRFARLLETLADLDEPDRPLARIDLLGPAERERVLEEWNDTAVDVPSGTLPDLFETQAARTPDALALLFEDESVTYEELNARANRLAHLLIDHGVGPETVVPVVMERSTDLVVALLGILKAGGAYLPVDPDHPADRIDYLLSRADAPVTVTEALIEKAGAHTSTDPDRGAFSSAHPAYVIFTSGSTGRPKGVTIPHQGIVNRLTWMQNTYHLTPHDRVLQKTPYGFDVS
ncbi:condensation domain-containing protein, partial [Kitasatospora sp. NPDC056327]|uniref:condensation domain-containing protein n=1 Tax=Kitasatospora sp. NPDC056327 TaxID=3345785 RepID=UPI0035DFCAC5